MSDTGSEASGQGLSGMVFLVRVRKFEDSRAVFVQSQGLSGSGRLNLEVSGLRV